MKRRQKLYYRNLTELPGAVKRGSYYQFNTTNIYNGTSTISESFFIWTEKNPFTFGSAEYSSWEALKAHEIPQRPIYIECTLTERYYYSKANALYLTVPAGQNDINNQNDFDIPIDSLDLVKCLKTQTSFRFNNEFIIRGLWNFIKKGSRVFIIPLNNTQ